MQLPFRDREEAVSLLAGGWEPFRGARIFLTGATGFVGRWLVETLAHANAAFRLRSQIVALSRSPESFLEEEPHLARDPGVAWVRGNLDDPALLESRMLPKRCDFVVHAATPSSRELAAGGPEDISRAIEATRRALDFAVRAGARRFLYLSSGAVYGRQPDSLARLPENFEGVLDPRDSGFAYAETKRRSEILCGEYADRHGLDAVIARGFAFVGPCLPIGEKFAAGSFLGDALSGAPIRIRGDGTPLRSYLYAGDMSAWLWTILLRGVSGRAYNVGSERAVSILDLARCAASLVDPPLPVQIDGISGRSRLDRYVPSTERARLELELAETVDWRDALRRTYESIREHPVVEAKARTRR